jgi:hypothetical protein
MNHLGDTNKMIRATPRMDASAHDDGAIWQTGCDIERELNAANVEIERLTNKVAQLYEGAEEQKQRIKRLEEVLTWYETKVSECNRQGPEGDAARDALANDLGRKAKEAKL